MPVDDRSETVNAAKPGTVRSAEVPSTDPASPSEPSRPTNAALLRLTLLLARLWTLVRTGSARLRDAIEPELARLRASGSVLRRAVAGAARPVLVRARRSAAFRAAER
ncbi:hypothetical protein I0C86_17940, partial [Plantactinospora sp. S1510]